METRDHPSPTSSSDKRDQDIITANTREDKHTEKNTISKMPYLSLALAVLSAGVVIGAYNNAYEYERRAEIPAQAQFIDQKAFNVLPSVLPPSEFNLTNVRLLSTPKIAARNWG